MKQKNITVKEHFIPQCYLKGFSPDKKRVYQYDMLNWKTYPLTNTNEICCEDYLYEFKDGNGDIVIPNTIENALINYEGALKKLLIDITKKSHDVRNFHTRTFLSTKEKVLLIGLMSMQVMRMPDFIKIGEDTAKQMFKIEQYQARNFSILTNLPIYLKLGSDDKTLFSLVANWFTDMSFMIFRSESHNIYTGDKPIYLYGKDKNNPDIDVKPEKVIYPLTSNLVLYMLPINKYPEYRNRLIPITPRVLKEVHKSIAGTSKRFLYSFCPLTEEEIQEIREARE